MNLIKFIGGGVQRVPQTSLYQQRKEVQGINLCFHSDKLSFSRKGVMAG